MQFSGGQKGGFLPPEDFTIRTARFRVKPDDSSIDEITTAGISGGENQKPPDQSYPGDLEYRVMFVSAGRALLRDGDSLLLATVGTRLPGGEQIKAFKREGAVWAIHLDTGVKLEWRQQ